MADLYHSFHNPSQAPPLIFLHGFMGDHRDWDPIIKQLPSEQPYLCVDLPGHGKTVWTPERITFDNVTNSLIDLLDYYEIPKCIPVGYSMGGRLALYFSLKQKERLSSLILISASPGIPDPDERQKRFEKDANLADTMTTASFNKILSHWYRNPIFDTLPNHPAYDAMIKRRQEQNPSYLRQVLKNLSPGNHPSLWGKLPQLDIPGLYIVGQKDLHYVGLGQRVCSLWPRAILQPFAQASHAVPTEDPSYIADSIKSLLGSAT